MEKDALLKEVEHVNREVCLKILDEERKAFYKSIGESDHILSFLRRVSDVLIKVRNFSNMPKHSVRISFPNEEALKRFTTHMSKGGGEYLYTKAEKNNDEVTPVDKIVSFEYAQGPDGTVMTAQTVHDVS